MPKLSAKFDKMADASGAVKALRQLGITKAWLDASDGYSSEFAAEPTVPGTDNAPSLSGLVLRSGGYAARVDKGPLLAADPMVSGMESREDRAKNHSTRLISLIPDDQLDAAKKIIRDMGGEF